MYAKSRLLHQYAVYSQARRVLDVSMTRHICSIGLDSEVGSRRRRRRKLRRRLRRSASPRPLRPPSGSCRRSWATARVSPRSSSCNSSASGSGNRRLPASSAPWRSSSRHVVPGKPRRCARTLPRPLEHQLCGRFWAAFGLEKHVRLALHLSAVRRVAAIRPACGGSDRNLHLLQVDLGAWAKQRAPAAAIMAAPPMPPAVSSDEQFPAMGAPPVSVAEYICALASFGAHTVYVAQQQLRLQHRVGSSHSVGHMSRPSCLLLRAGEGAHRRGGERVGSGEARRQGSCRAAGPAACGSGAAPTPTTKGMPSLHP